MEATNILEHNMAGMCAHSMMYNGPLPAGQHLTVVVAVVVVGMVAVVAMVVAVVVVVAAFEAGIGCCLGQAGSTHGSLLLAEQLNISVNSYWFWRVCNNRSSCVDCSGCPGSLCCLTAPVRGCVWG
jgi:hypothetical protein